MRKPWSRTALRSVLAGVCLLLMTLPAGADITECKRSDASSLQCIRAANNLVIDEEQITVSGISSGGFMAAQFHAAHHGQIAGAGVVAGGPPQCAEGNTFAGVYVCTAFMEVFREQLCTIFASLNPFMNAICSRADVSTLADFTFTPPPAPTTIAGGPVEPYTVSFKVVGAVAPQTPEQIDAFARLMAAKTIHAAQQGEIDPIADAAPFAADRFYIFRGKTDGILPLGISQALDRYWQFLGATAIHRAVDRSAPADADNQFVVGHQFLADNAFRAAPGLDPCITATDVGDTFVHNCACDVVAGEAAQICRAVREEDGDQARCQNAETATRQMCDPRNGDERDMAGMILKALYADGIRPGSRQPLPRATLDPSNSHSGVRSLLRNFNQSTTLRDWPQAGTIEASLADYGAVYVPPACTDGQPCKLHIAFHGCGMSGQVLAENASYNEWAQNNRIIVLYPTVAGDMFEMNPFACWDFWGYTGRDYYTQAGKQIAAVAGMVNALTGKTILKAPAVSRHASR